MYPHNILKRIANSEGESCQYMWDGRLGGSQSTENSLTLALALASTRSVIILR
jgi:hypothetical protein